MQRCSSGSVESNACSSDGNEIEMCHKYICTVSMPFLVCCDVDTAAIIIECDFHQLCIRLWEENQLKRQRTESHGGHPRAENAETGTVICIDNHASGY